MTERALEKTQRSTRRLAIITCANCGEEAQVRIPQFCNACWRMLKNRDKGEASERIEKATDDGKHKTVVFDRHWLNTPDKENSKT